MQLFKNGIVTNLVDPTSFNVKGLDNTVLPAEDRAVKVAFQKEVAQLEANFGNTQNMISEINEKLKYMKAAIERSEQPFDVFSNAVLAIENKIKAINDPPKTQVVFSKKSVVFLTPPI